MVAELRQVGDRTSKPRAVASPRLAQLSLVAQAVKRVNKDEAQSRLRGLVEAKHSTVSLPFSLLSARVHLCGTNSSVRPPSIRHLNPKLNLILCPEPAPPGQRRSRKLDAHLAEVLARVEVAVRFLRLLEGEDLRVRIAYWSTLALDVRAKNTGGAPKPKGKESDKENGSENEPCRQQAQSC